MSNESTIREARHQERQLFLERYPLREIEVNGVPWSYIAGGQGDTTILWLHGAAGDAHQLQRFIVPLAEETRFVAPTIPVVDRLEDVSQGIAVILAKENVDRLIVAGGSFGGMLAQAVARDRSARLEGLMLFDTAAPNANLAKRNRRKMAVLRHLPWPLLQWLFAKSLGRLLRLPGDLTEEQRVDLKLATERFRENFSLLTKERLLAHCALAYEFLASDPHAVHRSGPTLVIRSKDDPSQAGLTGLETLYPQARLIEFDGVGHLGSLLRCEDYLSAFREFIEARGVCTAEQSPPDVTVRVGAAVTSAPPS
ncbi:MAG: alpha/beta fold hydrolase [Acidobacteria bacterium]|nr:alpha/beta fold hydrolase [Acidobacteriota bacterium]